MPSTPIQDPATQKGFVTHSEEDWFYGNYNK